MYSASHNTDLDQFTSAMKSVRVQDDVGSILERIVPDVGFEYFALSQSIHAQPAHEPALWTNLPSTWTDLYREKRFHRHDPVRAVARSTSTPFDWDELESLTVLDTHQRGFLKTARENGFANGYTVPMNITGGVTGLCSFFNRTPRFEANRSRPLAQYIATYAFDTCRRIRQSRSTKRLSELQVSSLILLARGKTERTAAITLGVKPGAIRRAVFEANRLYRARGRIELLLRAVAEQDLDIGDILED